MGKKLHLALAVSDLDASIADYSVRLGAEPVAVVPGAYALWRTDALNVSIRCTMEAPGTLRHLGWEDSEATSFEQDTDVNGIVWERFNQSQQANEIRDAWPESDYAAES